MLKNLFARLRQPHSKIVVNGQTYHGTSVSIVNGKVLVDGEEVQSATQPKIDVQLFGDVEVLETASGNVTVQGQAGAVQTVSGNVECGAVSGSVSTVSGDVKASSIAGPVSTVSGDVRGAN